MANKLTEIERVLLMNQFRILSLIPNATDGDYYARCAEIFECGYTLNYRDALQVLRDWKEMPEEECQFVVDVFNMFTAIKNAKEDGVAFPDIDQSLLSFSGFGEASLSLYGTFLIERMGQYKSLKMPDWNLPTMWRYRPMLVAWKSVDTSHSLTKDDLQKIADAAIAAKNA